MTHLLRIVLGLLLLSPSLFGRNLEGRWGAGLEVMDYRREAALSIRLHPTSHLAATAIVGFDSTNNVNSTILGGQLHRYTALQENINFFLGTGAYLLSDKTEGTLATGIEIDGLLGAEFFIPSLPDLGFQFETGIGMRTLRTAAIKVLGDSFGGLGIHYYF